MMAHPKRALLPALALLAVPSPGSAQTTDEQRDFGVVAHVPGGCTLGAPKPSSAAQVNFRGINGYTLQIDKLTDPATLSTRGASIELSFEATCHTAHRLIIESQNNGLFPRSDNPPIPPTGFGTAVPYLALAHWGAHSMRLEADAIARQTRESWIISEPNTGLVLLRLEIEAGDTNRRENAPLLSGIYADTLRITLEPNR